jgi:hypothetical protein
MNEQQILRASTRTTFTPYLLPEPPQPKNLRPGRCLPRLNPPSPSRSLLRIHKPSRQPPNLNPLLLPLLNLTPLPPPLLHPPPQKVPNPFPLHPPLRPHQTRRHPNSLPTPNITLPRQHSPLNQLLHRRSPAQFPIKPNPNQPPLNLPLRLH